MRYSRRVVRLTTVTAALLGLALAPSAVARADQAKPLPPRVQAAAKAAFEEAQAADKAGDRARAIERYRYVARIAPHPNVSYNLGDVLRRNQDLRGAANAFRDYLKLSPQARDRAKVEKLIRTIEATPGQLDITSEDDTAVIFVDGVRADRPPPIFRELAPGPHRIDAFTALSFRSVVETIDFDRDERENLRFPARVDGNLVVSGSGWLGRAKVAIDGDDDFRAAEMITTTAGERVIEVIAGGCRWQKTVDVPADDVLYVYVDVASPKPFGKPLPQPKPPPPPPGATAPAPRPATKPAPPPCPKATISVQVVGLPPPA